MITLADIQAAHARIKNDIRRTPLMPAAPMDLAPGATVTFKLECLQVTGSFKARGAFSKLRSLTPEQVARGLVTASGGNHGIAVAYVGRAAGSPTSIFVPKIVSPAKAEKIKRYGAKLEIVGDVFDDANRAALALAERGGTYVHPFAEKAILAGQGTVALEILEQDPATDTILVAIGGGGLIAGIAVAAKALKPSIKIIGIEPVGAPTLKTALAAGRVTPLEKVTTKIPTMAARQSEQVNIDLTKDRVADIVLLEDEVMFEASRRLWRDFNIAAEPSGAASVAALVTGAYKPAPGERVCALICGAGAEGIG